MVICMDEWEWVRRKIWARRCPFNMQYDGCGGRMEDNRRCGLVASWRWTACKMQLQVAGQEDNGQPASQPGRQMPPPPPDRPRATSLSHSIICYSHPVPIRNQCLTSKRIQQDKLHSEWIDFYLVNWQQLENLWPRCILSSTKSIDAQSTKVFALPKPLEHLFIYTETRI